MSRKTNKTSHVLNLITNGGPETEETQGTQEGKPVTAPESQKPAPENKVIVVNETSENEKLSNEIKNRLEAQLEAEVAEAQAAGQVSAPARPEAEQAQAGEGEAAPQAEPSEPEAAPVQREQPPVRMQPASQDDIGYRDVPREPQYRMLNVMERILGNMDLEGQMKQYGVCLCSRCRADVQALVLTNLPAKYVIVDSIATSPIIGYYEGNYRTKIITEIAKACVRVKEMPRH